MVWKELWGRKFGVQRFEGVSLATSREFYKKTLKAHCDNYLVVPCGKNQVIYANEHEFECFTDGMFNTLGKDYSFFRKVYEKRLLPDYKKYVAFGKNLDSKKLAAIDNKRLGAVYKKFYQIHLDFSVAVLVPFYLEYQLMENMEALLREYLRKKMIEEKYDEIMQIVIAPEQMNAVTQERKEMLMLIKKVGGDAAKVKDTDVKKHASTWQWMPVYDFRDAPWSVSDFRATLAVVAKEEYTTELEKLEHVFKGRKKEFRELMKKYAFPKPLFDCLYVVHDLMFIKDYRDDLRREGTFYSQKLYAEIGKRLGLDLKEVTQLLSAEIVECLINGKKADKSECQKRLEGYVLSTKNGVITSIAAGKKAQTLVEKEIPKVNITEKELRGLPASAGNARGCARIIYTAHDLKKVKKDDIMIAVTTHPDFVPAMQASAAIVTDQGGMTSHAAIVAREFKKPCVVGTKLATKVFKDGDMVEVDAVRGIIRKI